MNRAVKTTNNLYTATWLKLMDRLLSKTSLRKIIRCTYSSKCHLYRVHNSAKPHHALSEDTNVRDESTHDDEGW